MLKNLLVPELRQLGSALVVPLGKAADGAIGSVSEALPNGINRLRGFPHPSSANGHRVRQFEVSRDYMRTQVDRWRTNRGLQ